MRNFGIVEPGIYRSGRYTMRELQACWQSPRIRRVVDLRNNPHQLLASSTYRRLGVEYIRFPVDKHAPVPHAVLQWFEPGTLIHCWNGGRRTGAAVALYRKLVCGWNSDAIWQELQRYGFGCIEKHPELLRGVLF